MANKRKASERVQNYPYLFQELEGELFGEDIIEQLPPTFQGEPFGEDIIEQLPPTFQGEPFGIGIEEPPLQDSFSTAKKPHRRLKGCKVYNYKGRGKTSREKRNAKLWATLYPTPKKK